MVVFLCEDRFEDILCAVYDAWSSGLGHKNVKIQLSDQGNMEMFCQYRDVLRDQEKAEKVMRSVKDKISSRALQSIYEASLSREEQKADWIYRFLILGFHFGRSVVDMLQYEPAYRVFELCRGVTRETHSYIEFLRFSRLEGGVLFGKIQPKNHILTMIAPHFADRLPGENWVICDVGRGQAAVHRADAPWILTDTADLSWERLINISEEQEFQRLWKSFFESISIKERENPACQRSHLPLRYREYMTEFQSM